MRKLVNIVLIKTSITHENHSIILIWVYGKFKILRA